MLKNLARIAVRKALSDANEVVTTEQTRALPLPVSLIDYVNFDD